MRRTVATGSGSPGLRRLAEQVIQRRRLVMATWFVVALVGAAAAGPAADRMSYDFSLPGQPGYEAAEQIMRTYGTGGSQAPMIPVITAPPGRSVAEGAGRVQVSAALARLRQRFPQLRIADTGTAADSRLVTDDGRTTYALVFVPFRKGLEEPYARPVTRALQSSLPSGYDVRVTGLQQLTSDGNAKGPGVLAETVLGGLGALAVLLFVFGSLLALLPLLVAAVSILTSFLAVLGLSTLTEVSFVVQFIVALVGLGVAIDYSLLIVARWREERTSGHSQEEALLRAMQTAGHTVLVSGVTVAIGLLALVFLPLPSLRSVGYGGMLIPLFSVLASLTLLPALLAALGGRLAPQPQLRRAAPGRLWTLWSRKVVAHRVIAATVAVGVLAALAVPALTTEVGLVRSGSLATSGQASAGLGLLHAGGVPAGVLTPIEVLVSRGDPEAVARRAAQLPGVATALAPKGSAWRRGSAAVVVAIPRGATTAGRSTRVVEDVRAAVADLPGAEGAAGVGAIQIDYRRAVYGSFPLMLSMIVLVTYVLLARAFRSLVLPLKAVVLNLAGLAATVGFLVVFWQHGHGSEEVFGIAPTEAITFYVPLMVFAFLYGLSMDYEVFILSRMREEYDAHGSNERAVVEGLRRTGRLTTSAALILFFAFVSLASAPQTDIKILATGLAFGIVLDATVIRALLVPALVSMFGRWNWWLPGPAAAVLRIPRARGAAPPVGVHDEARPSGVGAP